MLELIPQPKKCHNHYPTFRSYFPVKTEDHNMEAQVFVPDAHQDALNAATKSISADEIDSTFKSNSIGTRPTKSPSF